MPRLRPRQAEAVRLGAPNDLVEAIEDIQVGYPRYRWIPRGTCLRRDDPIVREKPGWFQVRYRLDLEEVNDG